MYENKKVLLIGGGGTLGTYTAEELIRLGSIVDVICLEDKVSEHERLTYYKGTATEEYLKKLFANKHYDGIVNFIHYAEVEDYKPMHELLSVNTEHLIFLSSYRVYADLQNPVTEEAPMLLDVSEDEGFLQTEKYAISKAKCEKYLREESGTDNWTVVRPVISFSERRFDVVICSGKTIIEYTKEKKPILLPKKSRNLTAGVDWAGNSGKIIANLLFKEGTFREAYTVSSGQNLTWGEVAEVYTELLGTEFEWVDTDTFWEYGSEDINDMSKYYTLIYDRFFDRFIDNTKMLKATGLTKDSFLSIKEGLKRELAKL